MLLSIYLLITATVFALLEIEIEGKNGWAKELPTFEVRSRISKIFRPFIGSRVLTGYHIYAFTFILLAFHVPFVTGKVWSWQGELELFSLYVIWVAIEDFMWFIFNPHFGINKFKKSTIPWHGGAKWVMGLFPLDYLKALFIYAILSLIVYWDIGDKKYLKEKLVLLITTFIYIFLAYFVGKYYRNWRLTAKNRNDR